MQMLEYGIMHDDLALRCHVEVQNTGVLHDNQAGCRILSIKL